MNSKKLISSLKNIQKGLKSKKLDGEDGLEKIADIVYQPENDVLSNDFENILDDNSIGYRDDLLDDDEEYSNDELSDIEDSSADYFNTDDPTIDIDSNIVSEIIDELLSDFKHYLKTN